MDIPVVNRPLVKAFKKDSYYSSLFPQPFLIVLVTGVSKPNWKNVYFHLYAYKFSARC